jgi:hypothetical protein
MHDDNDSSINRGGGPSNFTKIRPEQNLFNLSHRVGVDQTTIGVLDCEENTPNLPWKVPQGKGPTREQIPVEVSQVKAIDISKTHSIRSHQAGNT